MLGSLSLLPQLITLWQAQSSEDLRGMSVVFVVLLLLTNICLFIYAANKRLMPFILSSTLWGGYMICHLGKLAYFAL